MYITWKTNLSVWLLDNCLWLSNMRCFFTLFWLMQCWFSFHFLPLWQVIRVYIGSFWSHPLLIPDNRKLFEAEEQDLFKDIQSLPRNAALRKLNDLIKRARLAKVRYNWKTKTHPLTDGSSLVLWRDCYMCVNNISDLYRYHQNHSYLLLYLCTDTQADIFQVCAFSNICFPLLTVSSHSAVNLDRKSLLLSQNQ